jgi:hypothetical protein
MLDKLPPELVDAVLDHLPSLSSGDGARERMKTLRAFSLVFRQARVHGQAALRRDVHLKSDFQIRAFEQAIEGGSTSGLFGRFLQNKAANCDWSVRSIQAESYYEDVCSVVGRLLFHLPSVRELRLSRCQGNVNWSNTTSASFVDPSRVILTDLLPLEDLVSLSLNHVSLGAGSIQTTLPSLVRLSLNDGYGGPATMCSFLTASTLPALRILALSPFSAPGFAPYLPTIPPALRERLEALQLRSKDAEVIPAALLEGTVPVVVVAKVQSWFEQRTRRLIALAPPHLLLLSSSTDDVTAILAGLPKLVSSPSRLKSLHLPSFLHPSFDGPLAHFTQVAELAKKAKKRFAMEAVVARCERDGIEVVWHREEAVDEGALVASFERYARRMKR